jgi:hypothetical protein
MTSGSVEAGHAGSFWVSTNDANFLTAIYWADEANLKATLNNKDGSAANCEHNFLRDAYPGEYIGFFRCLKAEVIFISVEIDSQEVVKNYKVTVTPSHP